MFEEILTHSEHGYDPVYFRKRTVNIALNVLIRSKNIIMTNTNHLNPNDK